MKIVFDLLRNPLFKFIGIGVILYFALFSNRENPDSLGNRLSSERIKKNITEIQDKSRFIAVNVKMAQNAAKQKEEKKTVNTQIVAQDTTYGTGDPIACNEEAEITYGLYTAEGKQLDFQQSKIFVLGKKENPLLEKNIVGMRVGGVRTVSIPRDSMISDKKLGDLLRFHGTDLKYEITLLSISKTSETTLICE